MTQPILPPSLTWLRAMASMNCPLSAYTGRDSRWSLMLPFWMKPYDRFFFCACG